jgi:hypothetical protein
MLLLTKLRLGKDEVENMRKHIATLKNQVEYYKGTQNAVSEFIEEVLEEDKVNEQIRKEFIAKVVELQEVSLKLSILYNENLIWKEKQGKVQDQMSSLRKFRRVGSQGLWNHNIDQRRTVQDGTSSKLLGQVRRCIPKPSSRRVVNLHQNMGSCGRYN